LEKDDFFRPAISGPLPTPRFTAASVLFEGDGYLFVHGGFASQYGDSISDICILDLAPGLRREFRNLRVNPNARSHAPVTVEALELADRVHGHDFIMGELMQSSEENRQETANRLLQYLRGVNGDPRHVMLVNLFANGGVRFEDDGEEDEEDDDDDDEEDDDYVE
jgi:hypothetical protein